MGQIEFDTHWLVAPGNKKSTGLKKLPSVDKDYVDFGNARREWKLMTLRMSEDKDTHFRERANG